MNTKYLALGDSYTIGEAVPLTESFPHQLESKLKNKGFFGFENIEIIAVTGWTTDELMAGIENRKPEGPFGLVTLLIGVNNQYRGYPADQYRKEFEILLNQAISFAGGKKDRVLVVSIPDYGVTPFGAEKATTIDRELRLYNQINKEISARYGVEWTDVFDISKRASEDTALIAGDNLHPSGKMYDLWAEALLPKALNALEK
jgi:lysophospholipase L1-like esterase